MINRINQRLGFYEESEVAEPEMNEDEIEINGTKVEKRDVSGQILDKLYFEDIEIMYDLCRYVLKRYLLTSYSTTCKIGFKIRKFYIILSILDMNRQQLLKTSQFGVHVLILKTSKLWNTTKI